MVLSRVLPRPSLGRIVQSLKFVGIRNEFIEVERALSGREPYELLNCFLRPFDRQIVFAIVRHNPCFIQGRGFILLRPSWLSFPAASVKSLQIVDQGSKAVYVVTQKLSRGGSDTQHAA